MLKGSAKSIEVVLMWDTYVLSKIKGGGMAQNCSTPLKRGGGGATNFSMTGAILVSDLLFSHL